MAEILPYFVRPLLAFSFAVLALVCALGLWFGVEWVVRRIVWSLTKP